VWKATLSTHHGGGIALTTAVKTLKAGNDTSRKELLHEAALMALLEHGNLVAILGVVTAPRNMPALLVLEYCEYGTLISYVCMTDPEYLDTSMMLTFCHDVGCGLQYLSSRRIVHRDVAARNVLLDITKTCKVLALLLFRSFRQLRSPFLSFTNVDQLTHTAFGRSRILECPLHSRRVTWTTRIMLRTTSECRVSCQCDGHRYVSSPIISHSC
jgi:serine/threonine protein kinase